MLMTRSSLNFIMAYMMIKTTTISVRYSLVRRQFKDAKGEEITILNYQTQMGKIIPRICESYAYLFTSQQIRDICTSVYQDAKNGKFTRLNEAHILASATKAIISNDCLKGV